MLISCHCILLGSQELFQVPTPPWPMSRILTGEWHLPPSGGQTVETSSVKKVAPQKSTASAALVVPNGPGPTRALVPSCLWHPGYPISYGSMGTKVPLFIRHHHI